MKFLLDTHTFLWFIAGDEKLSDTARNIILDDDHHRFLSIASIWEIAIKVSLGKLVLTEPFNQLISSQIGKNQLQVLNISIKHTIAIANLPFYHRDPFDRMLVAQSIVECMPIVSIDAKLDEYNVLRIW